MRERITATYITPTENMVIRKNSRRPSRMRLLAIYAEKRLSSNEKALYQKALDIVSANLKGPSQIVFTTDYVRVAPPY